MSNGNKLKEIRNKNNISISILAKETDISERYLRFIEAGQKNPSLQTAMKIANSLNVTVDDIFCD